MKFNRRKYLQTLLAAGAVVGSSVSAASAKGIELHVDLSVDPAREQEMLKNFETIFKPAAIKQPGYRNVKLIKLRSALMGKIASDVNYRFILAFENEELRQKWANSAIHQKVWPTVEKTLLHKNYTVLLYDVV